MIEDLKSIITDLERMNDLLEKVEKKANKLIEQAQDLVCSMTTATEELVDVLELKCSINDCTKEYTRTKDEINLCEEHYWWKTEKEMQP